MKLAHTIIAGGLAACAFAAHAQKQGASSQKLYCWNDRGTRVCTDALPPEQAAGARTEISARSGRPVGEIQRALSAEERAAAFSADQAARLSADAETARLRRDLAMVESYASEADLRRAFNERIVLIDESIKTSVLSEANLRRGLVSLLAQASNLELTGRPVARPLQDNILKQRADLTQQVGILAQQRRDRGLLDADLDAALQRYRDLKNPRAQATETADTSLIRQ